MLEPESLGGVSDGVWFEHIHPVALRDERTAQVPAPQSGGADCAWASCTMAQFKIRLVKISPRYMSSSLMPNVMADIIPKSPRFA